jgi:hypothetical protein
LLKIYPYGLGKILDTMNSIGTPAEYMIQISKKLKNSDWAIRTDHTLRAKIPWSNALQGIGRIASVVQAVFVQAVFAVLKY